MVMRLAMLGSSVGNGHPYSFSAIINGYSSDLLKGAGWPGIASYLDERDPVDLGIRGVRVTHAWCPNPAETEQLCAATGIAHAVDTPQALTTEVDGAILARDDWESHSQLAAPFIDAGVPVFVDKPLTLDQGELRSFQPHLEAGTLMSCSGFRFAPELDPLVAQRSRRAPLVLHGVGPKGWDRYAVHLIEPLLRLTDAPPTAVSWLPAGHDAAAIEFADESIAIIHCLGEQAPGFRLGLTTPDVNHNLELRDRFTAFRRLLTHFVGMIETGRPPFAPSATITVMDVLAAGALARAERRRVELDEIQL